jgi:hypothetical protein
MSKSGSFRVIVLFAIVAFCACSQMALARTHIVVAARSHSQVRPDTPIPPSLAPGLYAISQAFVDSPYPNWVNNFDGYELWPCFGEKSTNQDCPTIGNPSILFPSSAVAVGVPYFTWSLADCDGTTNGTQAPYVWDGGATWSPSAINGYYVPCGQINNFYEDWTGDTTDDLLITMEVKQGASVIADSGIQDWGPNPYGDSASEGFVVANYQDFNFGALGDTGANNGNCVPDYNYPTSSPGPSNPLSYPVITAANQTCVDPVAGPATLYVTTTIATPTWTCKTKQSVTACKVTYANKYSLHQKWSILLQ